MLSTILNEKGIGGFCKVITANWGYTQGEIQIFIYEKVKKRVLVKQDEKKMKLLDYNNQLNILMFSLLHNITANDVTVALTHPHEDS